MINPLINLSIRHQVYLEGLKVGRHGDLAASLAKLQHEIVGLIGTINYEDLGEMRKVELNLLLGQMQLAAKTVFSAWLTTLIQWLKDYIDIDADFWRVATATIKARADQQNEDERRNMYLAALAAGTSNAAIYSFAKNMPLGANGVLLEPFAAGFATLAAARVVQAVSTSYANSESKDEAIKRIIGNKDVAYKDGLLRQLQRQGDAVTDTIIQHVAAQTNEAISKQLFNQYLWVSVLDSGTTIICRDRNGNVYIYGRGPTPPAHIGCRSSIIPFDGTGPVTMPTFRMWADGQSAEFINDAFDGEVGASYEGSKAINLKEFAGKRSLILA